MFRERYRFLRGRETKGKRKTERERERGGGEGERKREKEGLDVTRDNTLLYNKQNSRTTDIHIILMQ